LALQGNLDTLPIPEVLWVLAATRKTGCLRIQSDSGQGTLWLRDGTLTSAATDRVPGGPLEEVVGDLLRYQEGSFVFDVDDSAPERAEDPGLVEDVLDRARVLVAEWEDLRAMVPSLDHRVALVADIGDGSVTITADQWPTLTAVARGCSVAELAASLGLTELGVLRALDRLGAQGLTRIEAPPPSRPRHAARSTRLG
jgi:hypothetical protein